MHPHCTSGYERPPLLSRQVTVLVLFFCVLGKVDAQPEDRKNTVRFNITNPLLFGGKAVVVGYERKLSSHQTLSLNIGRMALPAFGLGILSDSLSLTNNSADRGFHLSTEYRFYLRNENKHEAPRGVYVGPYYSYNRFARSNSWSFISTNFNGEVTTDLDLGIHMVGVELGYQFVFANRVTLDLILIGPGLGSYSVKASLNTNLDPDEKSVFFQELNDYLADQIPGYNLVLDEATFRDSGSLRKTTFGFRYLINIGIRF